MRPSAQRWIGALDAVSAEHVAREAADEEEFSAREDALSREVAVLSAALAVSVSVSIESTTTTPSGGAAAASGAKTATTRFERVKQLAASAAMLRATAEEVTEKGGDG